MQDHLVFSPGRKRKGVREPEDEEAEDKEKSKRSKEIEKESAKKKRQDKKAWNGRRNTYDEGILQFIAKHAKDKLRWIEACYI